MKIASGMTFGLLTVMEKSRLTSSTRQSFWTCRCECGNIRDVRSDRLTSGKTKSCGHLVQDYVHSKRKPNRNVTISSAYSHYKSNAKIFGRVFNLTPSQFSGLVVQSCYYCNTPPTDPEHGTPHHGLDRVDNSIGYTPENVVPCCKTCNYAKHSMDYHMFTDWISKLSGFSLVGMLNAR